MSSDLHRLRKYRRKKMRSKTSEGFNRLARLYWRYHWKVYGGPESLWKVD